MTPAFKRSEVAGVGLSRNVGINEVRTQNIFVDVSQ